MLSILYILHHCNMLQSLGGNLPHRVLVRWGRALTCLLQMRWYGTHNLRELLGVLGCSAKQQDGSPMRQQPSSSPSPAQHPQHGEKGDKASLQRLFMLQSYSW